MRIALGLPLFLLAFGGLNDLFLGLPISRAARSPGAWLLGVTALGGLYLIGEGAIAFIGTIEQRTDSPWKQALYLEAMFWVLCLCGYLLWALFSAAK